MPTQHEFRAKEPTRCRPWAPDTHHYSAEYVAVASSVQMARHDAACVLRRWQQTSITDLAELVVSELVTNSIQHGYRRGDVVPAIASERITVQLSCAADVLLVAVWDGSPESPRPQLADVTDEGGRGLALVEQLSRTWGFYSLDDVAGKVVWAELSTALED